MPKKISITTVLNMECLDEQHFQDNPCHQPAEKKDEEIETSKN